MHRLRDLRGRQAWVAAAMVLLVLVPFGASAVRAIHVQWLPSGDDALIGLRAHDVFTAERPLLGQPSTSHLYGAEAGTSHPGPIEFYFLAVPLRLLGPAVGMILGSLAFNLAGVLVAAWVVLRRAGPVAAGWAMVLMSGVLWSEGTAILSDPISSNAGGMAMFALAACAWAVVDGDVRLLPLGALFGSWVAQQHLAVSVPAGGLVAYAVIGVAVTWVVQRRHRRPDRDEAEGATEVCAPAGAPARIWPWTVGALGLSLVLWAPVIWQQLTGDPGNLSQVIEYARHSETVKLGALAGVRQAIRAVGFPPLLTRSDLRGDDFFNGPLSPLEVISAIVSYGLLVAIVVAQWARRRTLALLALTALVLAAAGAYNGTSIPDSVEAFRVNFYRWAFVVAWLTWIAIGWMAVIAVRWLADRRGQQVPAVLPKLAPALALVVMLVPTIGNVATAGFDDERRDQTGFEAMRSMADAAVAEADGSGASSVTLVLRGKSSVLAAGSALALQLEEAGHPVTVPEQKVAHWGPKRVLEPGEDPGDLILLLSSSRGPGPEQPGRLVAEVDMNEDLRPLVEPLLAQALAADPVPSDRAEALLAQHYEPEVRDYIRGVMARLHEEPEAVLTDDELLRMIAEGYYESPVFDEDQVRALLAELPARTVNEDDVFELRVITPDELAAIAPSLQDGAP